MRLSHYRDHFLQDDKFMKALVPWRLPEDIVILDDIDYVTEIDTEFQVFNPSDELASNNSVYYTYDNGLCVDSLSLNCSSYEDVYYNDVSFNDTFLDPEPHMANIGLALSLYLACLATVFGNTLVIIAVTKERNLHSATNYLIASLAVADTLVGLLVMPFSATYEGMNQSWIFGPVLCDLWHSLDVLASTSSILHLCVISLDRYWAITDPFNYPTKMSDKRAAYLIIIVWICSSSISFPAIAWWRLTANGPAPPWKCPFTEDIGYLVFSSTVSFYGPLAVMVFTYIKIYQAATAYSKSLMSGTKQLGGVGNGEGEITLRIHRGGGGANNNNASNNKLLKVPSTESDSSKGSKRKNPGGVSRKLARFAKETKAAKTLGTVMGVFIICWLPFFVTNIIAGICPDCISNPELTFAILTWLGWINSSMNPVIYACCSHDFRRAFVKILRVCCAWKYIERCCRDIKINTRSRLEYLNLNGSCSSSSGKDFGFHNRPKIVANGQSNGKNDKGVNGNGVANKMANHTIIVTPVSSPATKTNGCVKFHPPGHNQTISKEGNNVHCNGGGGVSSLLNKHNISARYAVNYRSVDSSSSSTTATPVASSHNGSWDEYQVQQQQSITMRGGRGQSFFPVKTTSSGPTSTKHSFYNIPPPNFSYKPGVSGEKLL